LEGLGCAAVLLDQLLLGEHVVREFDIEALDGALDIVLVVLDDDAVDAADEVAVLPDHSRILATTALP
jgi:hypothetical protein